MFIAQTVRVLMAASNAVLENRMVHVGTNAGAPSQAVSTKTTETLAIINNAVMTTKPSSQLEVEMCTSSGGLIQGISLSCHIIKRLILTGITNGRLPVPAVEMERAAAKAQTAMSIALETMFLGNFGGKVSELVLATTPPRVPTIQMHLRTAAVFN